MTEEEQMKAGLKLRNKVLFVTPSLAQTIFSKGLLKNADCFSIVVDKINMHQAFDLDQDLIELTQTENFPKVNNVIFRTIFTTNQKSD